jgi:ABC-type transporter Mla MlaB component
VSERIPVPNGPDVIACDVSRIGDPDGPALDALVRLQLTARRMGTTIELHNACPALVDLIAIAGLGDVLVIAGSGVEMHGQVEEGEQRGIDEEVLGDDGAV